MLELGVTSRPGFLSRAGVGCLLRGKKSSLAAGPECAGGDRCVGALSQPLFGTFHPGSSQSPRLSSFHASQRLYVFHTAGRSNSPHARQELHSNNNNSWYLELLSRGRRPSLKKSTHVCSQQCGGGGLGLPARPGRDVRKLRTKHRTFPTGNFSPDMDLRKGPNRARPARVGASRFPEAPLHVKPGQAAASRSLWLQALMRKAVHQLVSVRNQPSTQAFSPGAVPMVEPPGLWVGLMPAPCPLSLRSSSTVSIILSALWGGPLSLQQE